MIYLTVRYMIYLRVAERAGILMTKVKNMMQKKMAMKKGSMVQVLSHFPVMAM